MKRNKRGDLTEFECSCCKTITNKWTAKTVRFSIRGKKTSKRYYNVLVWEFCSLGCFQKFVKLKKRMNF